MRENETILGEGACERSYSGKRLGLFGGSFDPVHCGHLYIAERAREVCGLDKVFFIPCACSPLKSQEPRATDEERLAMLSLATQGVRWAAVEGKDLEWPPPSWSWRLAEWFCQEYPGAELFWIMGTDQWAALEKWGRWEYLASMVTFIVHHRGVAPKERPGVRSVFVEGEHPASASLIREDVGRYGKWLPDGVRLFVEEKGLYSE